MIFASVFASILNWRCIFLVNSPLTFIFGLALLFELTLPFSEMCLDSFPLVVLEVMDFEDTLSCHCSNATSPLFAKLVPALADLKTDVGLRVALGATFLPRLADGLLLRHGHLGCPEGSLKSHQSGLISLLNRTLGMNASQRIRRLSANGANVLRRRRQNNDRLFAHGAPQNVSVRLPLQLLAKRLRRAHLQLSKIGREVEAPRPILIQHCRLAAAVRGTATATAATPAVTTTTATAARLLGTSLIDRQSPAVLFAIIQTFNRLTGGVVVAHFDETKPFAAARIAILNDFRTSHVTVLSEHFFELRVINAVAQITDIKLLTHN